MINFDQIPSKYVQVSSMRMEKKGTTNVPVSGVDNKRSTLLSLLTKRFFRYNLFRTVKQIKASLKWIYRKNYF